VHSVFYLSKNKTIPQVLYSMNQNIFVFPKMHHTCHKLMVMWCKSCVVGKAQVS